MTRKKRAGGGKKGRHNGLGVIVIWRMRFVRRRGGRIVVDHRPGIGDGRPDLARLTVGVQRDVGEGVVSAELDGDVLSPQQRQRAPLPGSASGPSPRQVRLAACGPFGDDGPWHVRHTCPAGLIRSALLPVPCTSWQLKQVTPRLYIALCTKSLPCIRFL